ncbi:MAG: hypothetical protein JNL82_31510 [Myxococcales bacterium]|jgi:hypothetical protein|nr:hypothetical protein [Myxococcales bacterium]
MAQPNRNAMVKKPPEKAPEPEEAPQSRLGWALGWVVIPGLLFGGLFVGGVYVGANHHDGWIASAVMWVIGLIW